MQCPNCGVPNRPGARHCKVCGQALSASPSPPPTQVVGLGVLPPATPAGGPHLLADNGLVHDGLLGVFEEVFAGRARFALPEVMRGRS